MESLQESKSQDEVMYKKEWLTQKYIKLNSGLVIQWVNQIKSQLIQIDQFKCEICDNIVWKPQICSECDYLYCEPCLKNYSQKQKNQNQQILNDESQTKQPEQIICNQQQDIEIQCPQGCGKFRSSNPRRLLENLNKIFFICPFKQRGCFRDDIQYQDFEKHLNQCYFKTNNNLTKYKYVKIIDQVQLEKEIIGSYIAYKIKTVIQGKEYEFFRRYQEFFNLNQYLKKKYQGYAIYDLPPKQDISHLLSYDLKQRKIHLQLYLELTSQNKIFENDNVLLQFLSEQKYEMQEQETFTQVLADQFIEIKQVVQDKSYQFYDYLKNTISQSISGAQNKNTQVDQQKHQEMINQLKIDEEQMESQFNFKDSIIKIQKQGKQQDQSQKKQLNLILQKVIHYHKIFENMHNFFIQELKALNILLNSQCIREKQERIREQYLQINIKQIKTQIQDPQILQNLKNIENTQNLDFHPEIQKLMPYPNNLNFSDSDSDIEQNNEDEDQGKISKKQKDSEDDIQIYELNCSYKNIQPEKQQKNKQSLKDKIFKQKQYQEDVDEQIKLLQNQDLGLGQEFQSMVRQYEYEYPSVGKLEDIQVNWIQILHQRKKEAYELNLKIFKTYLRIKSSENCVKSIEINQQQQKRQIEYIDQLMQQPESEIKIKQAQKTLQQLQAKETEIQKNTIQDCTQIIQRVNLEKNPIVHSFINYLQIYQQKLPQIKYQKIK